jgi:group I intron endonuclease
MLINKSLLKYGYSNFSLDILEYCKPEDCIKREQYYLNLLEPEYNILTQAGSLLGFKHTEETKAKFKNRKNLGNRKKLIRLYTEEEKLKIAERMAKVREARNNEQGIYVVKEETKK